MELKKESNNDLQIVWIIMYIFKTNTYFHSTAETRSLTEEYVETLSEAQEKDSTQNSRRHHTVNHSEQNSPFQNQTRS